MQRELSNFVDLVTTFEQTAGRFMAQIMEAQIFDSQHTTRSRECGTDSPRIEWENVRARLRLAAHDLPTLWRVFEAFVVSFFCSRMLRVPNEASSRGRIIVSPFEPANLRFATSRYVATLILAGNFRCTSE